MKPLPLVKNTCESSATLSSINNNRIIANVEADQSRASLQPQPFYASSKGLFSFHVFWPNEIAFKILSYCDCQTILALRQSTTRWNNCISLNQGNDEKVITAFNYNAEISSEFSELPLTNQPKFTFAKREKLDINIKVPIKELMMPSKNLRLLNRDHQLWISLKITNLHEIDQLRGWILHTVYSELNPAKIKKIDISTIKINKDTVASISAFLTVIGQQARLLPNLKTLILGDIENNTQWNLDATHTINSLTTLIIGKFQYHAAFTLTNLFPNLVKLSIGTIGEESGFLDAFSGGSEPLKFSSSLSTLKSLDIGSIFSGVSLHLPDLDNLSTLSIKDVSSKANVYFQNLPKLSDISIGNILGYGSIFSSNLEPLKFSSTLTNLINLKIGSIPNGTFIKLPEMNKLINLAIGAIDKKANIDFSKIIDTCLNLSINGVAYKLWSAAFNCDRLTVGSIQDSAQIHSAKTLILNKIEYLSFNLSDSLKNILYLTIIDIKCDINFDNLPP
ncbi:MAG: hypothetical protein C5B43_01660 [Verrucomicrobia bacterium]|nr:MAG: hypothetical protein C5B43_01660 [Verrucomicrobiota bacterium]